MIDINAIFAQAITAAIAQAVAPLEERIKQLEAKQAQPQPQPFDINAATDALNQQEWFWEKINGYIAAGVEAGLDQATTFDDFVSSNDLPDIDDIITTDNINEHIEEYLTHVRITRA